MGLTFDKVDDPRLDFSTDEGRAECASAKFRKDCLVSSINK